jgi:hypothetical protein
VGVSFAQIGEDVIMATAQMCTKDVTMFLPRAGAPQNTGVSSPLLPQTDSAENTNDTVFGRGTGKRGK